MSIEDQSNVAKVLLRQISELRKRARVTQCAFQANKDESTCYTIAHAVSTLDDLLTEIYAALESSPRTRSLHQDASAVDDSHSVVGAHASHGYALMHLSRRSASPLHHGSDGNCSCQMCASANGDGVITPNRQRLAKRSESTPSLSNEFVLHTKHKLSQISNTITKLERRMLNLTTGPTTTTLQTTHKVGTATMETGASSKKTLFESLPTLQDALKKFYGIKKM
jgi:hypothetical protein